MANIVWSMLYRLPQASDEQFERLLRMARLWADHLRGPAEHRGPIVLLSNTTADLEGVERIPIEVQVHDRRRIFLLRPPMALRHFRPSTHDRLMQLDLDSLARRPIAPMFNAIEHGEMRVAPSRLPLTHPQQIGYLLGPWRRRWYGYLRGWRRRPGVSASLSACTGQDWSRFMKCWANASDRHRNVTGPLGDQACLNYLYAFNLLPMRRYGSQDIHHLRTNDSTPSGQIDRARVLHFPLPDKLDRMREWSRV